MLLRVFGSGEFRTKFFAVVAVISILLCTRSAHAGMVEGLPLLVNVGQIQNPPPGQAGDVGSVEEVPTFLRRNADASKNTDAPAVPPAQELPTAGSSPAPFGLKVLLTLLALLFFLPWILYSLLALSHFHSPRGGLVRHTWNLYRLNLKSLLLATVLLIVLAIILNMTIAFAAFTSCLLYSYCRMALETVRGTRLTRIFPLAGLKGRLITVVVTGFLILLPSVIFGIMLLIPGLTLFALLLPTFLFITDGAKSTWQAFGLTFRMLRRDLLAWMGLGITVAVASIASVLPAVALGFAGYHAISVILVSVPIMIMPLCILLVAGAYEARFQEVVETQSRPSTRVSPVHQVDSSSLA